MPEPLDALDNVLADLQYAASQARLLGSVGEQLAVDLEGLVARYQGGADKAAPVVPIARAVNVPEREDISPNLTEFDDNADENSDEDFDEDFDEDPDEDAALRGVLDELGPALHAAATPQAIVLHVRRTDGFGLLAHDAREAVTTVLPSLVAVVGPLEIGAVEPDETDAAVAHVTLTAGADTNLAQLGAGQDGFNAAFPLVGVGDIVITSRVDDPADPELAAQLGLLAADLPEVDQGEHRINGVLTLIEQETGVRPQAQTGFTVRYSKDNGAPLSVDEVRQILAHPVSAGPGGLARFGQSVLLDIVDGPHDSVKIARFGLVQAGEIDLATVAITATQYRGTFNFGGTIGLVSANAEAQLIDEDVDVDA
jgi:hypothetical protein